MAYGFIIQRMTELKGGREFGRSATLGPEGTDFLDKPLSEQVIEMGWSHACPVVDEVIKEYGPEWTLKRYAECNFVFGLIVESAKDLNPDLYRQLTTPTPRIEGEKPGREFKPELIPDNFYKEMSPLSTPWGYALPRVIIEEMGRGENNKDRTQKRILKSLNLIDKTVKSSKTPIELLVKMSEAVVKLDANPKDVLSHVLANGILIEEGTKTMFDEIKSRIDRFAPVLRETYNAMSEEDRKAAGIINF